MIMHPKLLFGKSYMALSKQELLDLIKSTLPRNLMILILEGIVPVNPNTSAPMYNTGSWSVSSYSIRAWNGLT